MKGTKRPNRHHDARAEAAGSFQRLSALSNLEKILMDWKSVVPIGYREVSRNVRFYLGTGRCFCEEEKVENEFSDGIGTCEISTVSGRAW